MRRFFNSLSFKIGSVLILTEIIIFTSVSIVYISRFSDAIDRRIEDRVQLPGKLLNNSLIRLISIGDPDSLRLLVGEDIVSAMLIDSAQKTVIYSFQNGFQGGGIEDIPEFDPAWLNAENPAEQMVYTREGDNDFIVSVTPIKSSNSQFMAYFLYIKASTDEAEAEKASLTQLLFIGSAGTVLITFLAVFLSFRFMIFRRIAATLRTLKHIEKGILSARIDHAISADEIGLLQRGVNAMAGKREQAEHELTQLNAELEARVANRTRDLEVAADVSSKITTALDLNTLLPQVVELTRDGFNLYHVAVYLHIGDNGYVYLVAATGDEGQIMLRESKKLAIDDAMGLAPLAARQCETIVVNDVATSPQYRSNVYLPDTRSEAVLPMMVGAQLIGILDLQSEQANRFLEDDVRVLTTLAEQIGIAVRNAQLYTEVQKAREAAEQADRGKSMFLAAMSHELRTPLNGILNFTQFVSSGKLGPVNEKQVDLLQKATANGEHLLSLINDVLDISKIESGSFVLSVSDGVDVEQEALSVIETCRTMLKGKPVRLELLAESDLPQIRGDRRRIRQIILNLVSNACKFTDEGEISVSIRKSEGELFITVRDTGPGIAPKDHIVIFEVFGQTDRGVRHSEGTGLGLPISLRLAEAHGGRLWLESEPGKGTSFFVALPLHSRIPAANVKTEKA